MKKGALIALVVAFFLVVLIPLLSPLLWALLLLH